MKSELIYIARSSVGKRRKITSELITNFPYLLEYSYRGLQKGVSGNILENDFVSLGLMTSFIQLLKGEKMLILFRSKRNVQKLSSYIMN